MTLHEPSWDQARLKAHSMGLRGEVETLDIAESVGRCLAADVLSLIPQPPYETSAMDGYGVCGNGPWKIVASIRAGVLFNGTLADGEAIALATGAVIPAGCSSVIRWENATVENEILNGVAVVGKDIRPAGEEAKLGDLLIAAGRKLTPGEVGLLAASGYEIVEVFKKPRVGILILGDEIQRSGLPHDGNIRDSLGPQLPGWIEALGCEVSSIYFVEDELEPLVSAIDQLQASVEIIITTGSTANGPRDFLHQALGKLNGVIEIDEVAVRPGHPQLLATLRGTYIFGLPGNPQSAVASLMTIGRSLIDAIFGRPLEELPEVVLVGDYSAQPGFTRMIIGQLQLNLFTPSQYLGSAMLRGFSGANGFAIITNPPTSIRWLELPA